MDYYLTVVIALRLSIAYKILYVRLFNRVHTLLWCAKLFTVPVILSTWWH